MVWAPPATCLGLVFHFVVQGAAVDVFVNTPSTYNCTLTTPTLSQALTVMDTLPDTLAPEAGEVMEIRGVLVSAGAATLFTVNKTDALVALPAASRAVAVTVCPPLAADVVFQEHEYGAAVAVQRKAPSI